MEQFKGITFGESVTFVKTKSPVVEKIKNEYITVDDLAEYLELKEDYLFGRQKEVNTRKETEQKIKLIEERLGDKERLYKLVYGLYRKEELVGLSEEDARLQYILTKLYLITS